MEQATKILSDEHQHILKVIRALKKECQLLGAGKKLDKDFFNQALDFIRNYADKFHHAKEEEILFKELCKDSVQMRCNPVEQMLSEHDLGRNFVRGMAEGLSESDPQKVRENTLGYAVLLEEHIFKEDNILYPMADQALSAEAQAEIIKQFKLVEQTKFNQSNKEKYLDLVKQLTEN